MPAMKDIQGYEGLYTLSESGEVYTIKRKHFRKLGRDKDGYKQIDLWKNGKGKTFKIHRLVAIHYLEPMPIDKPLALHKDGDKLNCHFSNLYWGDDYDNAMDNIAHGNHWQVNKKVCSRGHILEHPNLVLSQWNNRGWRSCRSCHAARNWYRDNKEESLDWYADNKYYPMFKPTIME